MRHGESGEVREGEEVPCDNQWRNGMMTNMCYIVHVQHTRPPKHHRNPPP